MSQIVPPEIVEVNLLRPMLQAFNEDLGQYINDQDRYRLGRVLTIIDASFTDPEQRKAVKDLVQNEWWSSNQNATTPSSHMYNPHSSIRGLTMALGFELYPETAMGVPLSSNPNWAEDTAKEHFEQTADIANKTK